MDKKVKILIIDDEKDICENLKDIFQEIGYCVDTVQTGREGIRMVQRQFFHIALIDVILKDMDGIEVLKVVKEFSPETQGIVITGNATLKNSIESLNTGAFSYLIKPLDMDEVRAVIRKSLDQQRVAMENLLLKKFNESIVAHIPSGLLVLDGQHKILVANKSYCRVFHVHKRDIEGKTLNEVLSIKGLDKKLKMVQKNHQSLYDLEFHYHSPQTGSMILNISISEVDIPLINTIGEDIGLLLVIQDFTEHKRLEGDLVKSQKMAVLGETAARMAHELRNPLQKLNTGAHYFQQYSSIDDEAKIMLRGIINGTQSINKIITELLDYARPVKLNCRHFDIHNVIDGVLFEAEEVFKKSNITVRKEYDKNLKSIWVDGFRIKQAFQNITKNALDAMPDGGYFTITTYVVEKKGAGKPSDILEVRFADTGCGIPKEEIKNIFTPFYTGKEKGIGLGMSIAKNMIDLHEGEILVQSRVGKGTLMIVRLLIR